jgi:hypothetical protein
MDLSFFDIVKENLRSAYGTTGIVIIEKEKKEKKIFAPPAFCSSKKHILYIYTVVRSDGYFTASGTHKKSDGR